MKLANPSSRIWYSDPTWPNDPAMVKHLGLASGTYRYFDEATRGVDFTTMMEDLQAVEADDAVILHGCCHNPTGANLSADQWEQVTDLLLEKGALPFIDFAYQGFGDGLEEDAAAVRKIPPGRRSGFQPRFEIRASSSAEPSLHAACRRRRRVHPRARQ